MGGGFVHFKFATPENLFDTFSSTVLKKSLNLLAVISWVWAKYLFSLTILLMFFHSVFGFCEFSLTIFSFIEPGPHCLRL